MPLAPSALASASLIADGFLALTGLSAALIVFARRDGPVPSRPVAVLLGAIALAGGAPVRGARSRSCWPRFWRRAGS
jgi:hypothetical protein